MPSVRWIICGECGGEGRHYGGHANDPYPKDYGPCEACDGAGEIEIEAAPIEMEDLSCEE